MVAEVAAPTPALGLSVDDYDDGCLLEQLHTELQQRSGGGGGGAELGAGVWRPSFEPGGTPAAPAAPAAAGSGSPHGNDDVAQLLEDVDVADQVRKEPGTDEEGCMWGSMYVGGGGRGLCVWGAFGLG